MKTGPTVKASSAGGAAVVPGVAGFQPGDAEAWDAYVASHPHGTIFHTLRWRDAIRATFKHKDRYLVARRDGQICGVLPLVEVSSWMFGTSLVSVPFGVYGGLLVDDDEASCVLIDHARGVAETLGAKYVELRHLHPVDHGLPGTHLYHTFIEPVPDTVEGCLTRIPRKARAEVRKAIKRGDLVAEFDTCQIPELYRLFSINKRKLGSPIFPSSLFWHMKNQFGDDAHILSIKHEGRVLAAVMSFIHRGTVMPYYSGTLPGAERLSASNFMYHHLMEWACERDLEAFDFGRSREGTGAFAFKKHQGFTPRQLSYDYILNTAPEVPELNPSNPKYELAKNVFRKMPLWMAQKIGSWVVKRAPF